MSLALGCLWIHRQFNGQGRSPAIISFTTTPYSPSIAHIRNGFFRATPRSHRPTPLWIVRPAPFACTGWRHWSSAPGWRATQAVHWLGKNTPSYPGQTIDSTLPRPAKQKNAKTKDPEIFFSTQGGSRESGKSGDGGEPQGVKDFGIRRKVTHP